MAEKQLIETSRSLAIASESPNHIKPEWLRIPEVGKTFGIKRTRLYELINSRQIRSVSLRERGQVKGTRLISYDSVVEFLESKATGGINHEQ